MRLLLGYITFPGSIRPMSGDVGNLIDQDQRKEGGEMSHQDGVLSSNVLETFNNLNFYTKFMFY